MQARSLLLCQFLGQNLCFFLEKVATSRGFLGPVLSQVKKDRQFGITFPEFLEEVTNCFDYLKLEICLTCKVSVLWCALNGNIQLLFKNSLSYIYIFCSIRIRTYLGTEQY